MSFQLPKDLFALDLGTTKFCIAHIRSLTKDKIPKIETVSVKASGMRKGMLSDLNEAKKSILQLLEVAERQFNKDIHKVCVGVAGCHLSSRVEGVTELVTSETVIPETLVKLESTIKEKSSLGSKELLHTVALGYRLDDRPWTSSPVGFSANRLSGKFLLIEADKLYLSDMVKLLNSCGLEVSSLSAEPLASAMVSTSDQYKKLGCVIIDIGGGTTDGMIYQSGKPVKLFTINIGGKLMSNDLAIGLGISFEEAEKVKIRFGLTSGNSDFKMQIKTLKGDSKMICYRDVYPILAPRIKELSELIYAHMQPFLSTLGGGLLVTGGGSEVLHIIQFLDHILPVSVKKTYPGIDQAFNDLKDLEKSTSIALSTKYATAVGLLALRAEAYQKQISHQKVTRVSRYFGQFVNWLKDLS